MLNIKEFEEALARETRALKNYQQDRYGGLLLDSDLENFLKDKFFGVDKQENLTVAAIFDEQSVCDVFCELAFQYKPMSFSEFKRVTNGDWKNPYFYHKHNNYIFYSNT
ncbi:MAG: hypothetical protein NC299_10365 [Lachnospiraceae bacterium]|nr:hypothetical protein [Ruminococcus sp.]MCM1275751.1 hypothetical protein [Lachnospiraceae bacterium]